MANPFPARFDSRCDSCGNDIDEGDQCYAIEGQFVCSDCANESDNVCGCGNFKHETYPTCFDCK